MGKFAGKVVVLSVKSKSGWKSILAPPPLKGIARENHHLANDENGIRAALDTVCDGDILVFNAHANEDYFIYGTAKTPIYWTYQNKKNPGFWDYLGRKKPPRLRAVIIASCMTPKGKTLSRKRLRELKRAFHASLIVAPNSRYESDEGDNTTCEKILDAIIAHANGKIGWAELNRRIVGDQDRFGVSFGCNGNNHPEGCNCPFGPRWKSGGQ